MKISPETSSPAEKSVILPSQYAEAIDLFLTDPDQTKELREDQLSHMVQIRDSLYADEHVGYVDAATGVGKTVLFVKLAVALQNVEQIAGRKPRLAIATSRKDLVDQIMGKYDTSKGFARFAPQLKVGSYFSDSSQKERYNIQDYDVTVTTYPSLKRMSNRELTRPFEESEREEVFNRKIKEIVKESERERIPLDQILISLDNDLRQTLSRRMSTGERIIDYYDLFFLDEGHNALGESVQELIARIPSEKPIIAFTGSPDASNKRRLKHILPKEMSKQTSLQAIEEGLLAPVMVVGVKSSSTIEGSDLYDNEGDYIAERLGFLARDSSRNRVAIEAARVVTGLGYNAIAPCLPGDEALHSRLLASKMFKEGIAAEAVFSGIKGREKIYDRYNAGDLNVLTYTKLLGEGWDSSRAKACINVAPTRSDIVARQRIGRVLRLHEGKIAIAIDIIDDYDQLNPPIHVTDVLGGVHRASGDIIGNPTKDQIKQAKEVLAALKEVLDVIPEVRADYSRSLERTQEYPDIQSSGVISRLAEASGYGHYALSGRVSLEHRGVNDEILDKLFVIHEETPDITYGYHGYTLRQTYNTMQAKKLLEKIPEAPKDKALRDKEGNLWMSSEAYTKSLQGMFPDLEHQTLESILYELRDLVEWQPAFTFVNVGKGYAKEAYKAFRADKESATMIARSIKDYFAVVDSL